MPEFKRLSQIIKETYNGKVPPSVLDKAESFVDSRADIISSGYDIRQPDDLQMLISKIWSAYNGYSAGYLSLSSDSVTEYELLNPHAHNEVTKALSDEYMLIVPEWLLSHVCNKVADVINSNPPDSNIDSLLYEYGVAMIEAMTKARIEIEEGTLKTGTSELLKAEARRIFDAVYDSAADDHAPDFMCLYDDFRRTQDEISALLDKIKQSALPALEDFLCETLIVPCGTNVTGDQTILSTASMFIYGFIDGIMGEAYDLETKLLSSRKPEKHPSLNQVYMFLSDYLMKHEYGFAPFRSAMKYLTLYDREGTLIRSEGSCSVMGCGYIEGMIAARKEGIKADPRYTRLYLNFTRRKVGLQSEQTHIPDIGSEIG